MAAFAVIAAGGSGQRLGSPTAKFETILLGRPMVIYSLQAFQQSASIESIVLVVPPERLADWEAGSLRSAGITKAAVTVAGGDSRQASVYNGLKAIGARGGTAVVHDAARPMITPEIVGRVCDIADGVDGQIAAVPVTDTVKRVEGGRVAETLDRSRLVSVQTPQAFDLATLIAAHESARADGFEGTDDASLVERSGGIVATVEGDRENIKVTYPEDLVVAQAIMSGRGSR